MSLWTEHFGSFIYRRIIRKMASNKKKRKRRNRLIIAGATIGICICLVVMVLIALEWGNRETAFLLWEIPVVIGILMIFFMAKDRIR